MENQNELKSEIQRLDSENFEIKQKLNDYKSPEKKRKLESKKSAEHKDYSVEVK